MRRTRILLIIIAITSSAFAKVDLVTLPDRETVQLTIYNSADMTLARESRPLTLKEGENQLQFSWENTLIDPTSLEMLPKEHVSEIDIANLTFPPRVRNLGLWNIKSEFSGKVPIEITYLTSGLSWRAFYMGTLTENEEKMRLQGYVRVINNSGEDYANAQTRLIVGQVHMLDQIADLARRQYPYKKSGSIVSAMFETVSLNGEVSQKPDVGWWKLNDGEGIIAEDSSGMGNDGIVHNPSGGLGLDGSVWVNDPERGIVASFNGDDSAGAYISAGSIPAMNLTNDFTWAFWAKVLTSAEGAGDNDVIAGNRYRPEGWPYESSGLMFIKFTPSMFEYYGSSNEGIDYPNLNISPDANVWIHHVVVKKANTLTYYRNGVQAGESALSSSINVINPFYIGGDEQGERTACYISDVRLWNKALTKDEIQIVMQDLSIAKGSSEYFLYTIEGRETIENGCSKRLISFDVEDVNVANLYKFEEEGYGNNVIRFLSFTNDEKHNLGETPIPGGMLEVYRNVDEEGHLSYTGQSAFRYIPVNEEVELNLGFVSNVVVKPKQMDFKTENYRFDREGDIIGWDEIRMYTIEVKNTRDIPIKVEIKRNFPTRFWQITGNDNYEEYNSTSIKFTIEMNPESKQTITYTLRTFHGTREDDAPPRDM